MQVNFFVITTPKLLDGFPASYVTSFHLPEAQAAFVSRLSQRFPEPDGDRHERDPAPGATR